MSYGVAAIVLVGWGNPSAFQRNDPEKSKVHMTGPLSKPNRR